MDGWVVAAVLVAGMLLGAIAAGLVMRTRMEARIAAAVTLAQTPIQVELATLTERSSRIPALEESLAGLERDLNAARQANNAHSQEKAALKADADRLPGVESESRESTVRLEALGRANATLTSDLQSTHENLASARDELVTERGTRNAVEAERNGIARELAALRERFDAEQKGAEEKLALLTQAGEALTNQFEVLANKILEDKSKRFTEQNQANLNGLLEPLRTKLTEFQSKVEQVHIDGGRERFALTEQVKQLVALNQTLSDDAKNLTSALKGSAKSQGSWGELILERVLEAAGLRKGHEYVAQERQSTDDGRKLQPDVVISLPEERFLVVDSKVSLVAYERYASADLEDERAIALKQHLDSVRAHVRGLADKNYQALYGLQSLDFVLLFVPIEPAFMLAVTNDRELFMDAWQRNVLLVSPSTLLFVVRTVAHLWRQEAQSRNAQEIASRGAELYDKLVGFVEDLRRVGVELKSAQAAYDEAEKKLSEGKGNVIRQAEMLRGLGVKPTKHLPRPLVDRAVPETLLPELAGVEGEPPSDVTGVGHEGLNEAVEGQPTLP